MHLKIEPHAEAEIIACHISVRLLEKLCKDSVFLNHPILIAIYPVWMPGKRCIKASQINDTRPERRVE